MQFGFVLVESEFELKKCFLINLFKKNTNSCIFQKLKLDLSEYVKYSPLIGQNVHVKYAHLLPS